MTHETAVHRWDVQQAFGRERPIEPEMARDGVDEALTVYMPFVARPESKVLGAGETYLFESIDAPGAWTVRFAGDAMEVRREAAPAGVTVHGNASDLMLFVWHRIPVDRLTVEGDRALLARYAALSPPD
jgi:uncharacterized protein (TIGR03083 family)